MQRCDGAEPARTSSIERMAPSPSPLIAVSPKRTPSGTTVKCRWLSLMSGGSTGDAAIAALADVQRELVGVGGFDGQQRRREMARVVGLEVGGLIRELGVSGRMRLVEAVTGEVLDQIEDLRRLLLADPLAGRPP